MFAVGLGSNSMFVTIGVFDTMERLEKALTDAGAVYLPEKPWSYTYKDHSGKEVTKTGIYPAHWSTTDEFSKFMEEREFPWYSTAGEDGLESLRIKEFEPNTIAFGYDDD